MQLKFTFSVLLFCILAFTKAAAQADPGSAGITFSKSVFQVKEQGSLRVLIGNYTEGISSGTALKPYDAIFTITIPSLFSVTGEIDLKAVPFPVILVSQMMNAFGSTIIVLTAPKGIPKGANGTVIIPVVAVSGSAEILYATVKTDFNLSYPPSGNMLPTNDLASAPVVVVSPLPVILSSFKVYSENLKANLFWTTTQEKNSERFDIERSQDGKQWEQIGSVSSAFESSEKQNYRFTDSSPKDGTNYYRLKMVDKDQSFTHSNMCQANFQNIRLEIYPNPVAETLNIRLGKWSDVISIALLSSDGVIHYESGKILSEKIDVRAFKNGSYIFKLKKQDNTFVTQRIMIVR